MLELKNITKDYPVGSGTVHALQGISVRFRENEFVSILGHSGCGKTTLLNIIGGLDRYTSGDLLINGVSTKKYRDRDWDTYRNHSVGFVFQNYNLIPHQSVLSNVELALTLSGVSKKERRKRARDVLTRVGLEDQMSKRPNQLSGGQMQRVAIARALVNNPRILLADEPTGALDSETSIQIMELLKEVAKDRLVIMVTHNPELAQRYSTRIIRLVDGKITDDSMPCSEPAKEKSAVTKKEKKPSMSFFTAMALSFNNLMTKKARTILISFAGSIGIIGIALILALSSGVQSLIGRMQTETLSSYPIQIEKNSMDMTAMMTMNREQVENDIPRDPDHPAGRRENNRRLHALHRTGSGKACISQEGKEALHVLLYCSFPQLQQPDDQEGPDHSHFLRRFHRHHRNCPDSGSLQRGAESHREDADGNSFLLSHTD